MIKQTQELHGVELDIAVAIALGFELEKSSFGTWRWMFWGNDFYPFWYGRDVEEFKPTKDWGFMGTLIDPYGIEFKWVTDATIESYSYVMEEKRGYGGNHLEAACRLIVLSTVGEEINIPEVMLEIYHAQDACK